MTANPESDAAPEWSPDGKKIYFHRSSPRESIDLVTAQADGAGATQRLTNTLRHEIPDAISSGNRNVRRLGPGYVPGAHEQEFSSTLGDEDGRLFGRETGSLSSREQPAESEKHP